MSCWSLALCGKDWFRIGCGDGGHDLSGEAFGVPPKTVRAMLAFLIVGFTFLGFTGAIVVFSLSGQFKLVMGIVSTMTNIASLTLGYYFGSRTQNAAISKLKESTNKEIDEPTFDEEDA